MRLSKFALIFLAQSVVSQAALAGSAGDAAVMIGDVTVSRGLFSSPGNLERKIGVCAQCHGAKGEGSPKYDTPALNSSSARYIAKELENYRAKIRQHTEMGEMASLLSNADIRAISQYYGSIR